eukprot:15079026-Alexandrium_andersonii.AAC.1
MPKRCGDLGAEVPKWQAVGEGRGAKREARLGGPRGPKQLPKVRRSVTPPALQREHPQIFHEES